MEGLDSVALVTLGCSWGFTALVILGLVLQIYTKCCISHSRIDYLDFLTFFTFLCSLALVCQTTWTVVDEGQGRHVKDEAPSEFEIVAKSLTANEIVWTFISMLIRCTAAGFLLKLFPPRFRSRWLLFIILTLAILHGIASILTACLICQPIAVDWDSSINGSCDNQSIAFIVIETAGLVLDAGLVFCPCIYVSRLQMERRKKVEVSCLLGLGGLNVVFTGLRFASLQRVTSNDFTYDRSFLALFSCLGALSGVLLGIIPTLKPLFTMRKRPRASAQDVVVISPHATESAGELRADERTRELREELTREHPEEVKEEPTEQPETETTKDLPQELTKESMIHDISIPIEDQEEQIEDITIPHEIV